MRTYGEVAVVTARDVQPGNFYGNSVPEALRATHVLVRRGEGWRLATVHMSFIAAPLLPTAATAGPSSSGPPTRWHRHTSSPTFSASSRALR